MAKEQSQEQQSKTQHFIELATAVETLRPAVDTMKIRVEAVVEEMGYAIKSYENIDALVEGLRVQSSRVEIDLKDSEEEYSQVLTEIESY